MLSPPTPVRLRHVCSEEANHAPIKVKNIIYGTTTILPRVALTILPTDEHSPRSVLAKSSPHVASPERFALHIASHVVQKYGHIHKAFVDIESLKWSRIPVQGVEHKHSFVRDGEERRLTSVEVSGP